jgi:hypothetical protein
VAVTPFIQLLRRAGNVVPGGRIWNIVFNSIFENPVLYPVLHKALVATAGIYVLGIVFSLVHNNKLSYDVLNYNTPLVGLLSIAARIYCCRERI